MAGYYYLSVWSILTSLLVMLCLTTCPVNTSKGDKDTMFLGCLNMCQYEGCDGTEYRYQPRYLKFLGWDCKGECEYYCMWEFVALYLKHDMKVPQFYGKWPFVRYVGLQEPASVLASIFNLLVHIVGLYRLRRYTSPKAPLYWFWHIFALVCMNGWIWSTVFHTRDTPFTEHMDYFSAFSMVLFSFFSAFVRIFEQVFCSEVIGAAVLMISFFTYHIYYLAFVHFDYGYNMRANIGIGGLNALVWILWSWRNRRTHRHIWKGALFIILALSSVGLEVNDFLPIYWILDAHALWHFSSALITPLWYSFLIDDCNYLHEKLKVKVN